MFFPSFSLYDFVIFSFVIVLEIGEVSFFLKNIDSLWRCYISHHVWDQFCNRFTFMPSSWRALSLSNIRRWPLLAFQGCKSFSFFFFLCILAGERKRFCPMSILGEFYYPLTMCLCCPCSPTSNHRPEHPYLSLEATCSSSNQDVCAHQCPLGYLTMCSPHCVQCTVVLYSGCIIGVCANKDSFLFLCSILSVAQ